MKLNLLTGLLILTQALLAQNFTEVSQFTPFEGVEFSSIAFADVDGDNDQDVLITGRNNSETFISKLYTNDGMGSFSEMPDTPFDGVFGSSIAFADVDGDNDQDVLITGFSNSFAFISKLYTNDGMGNFSEMPGTPFEGISQGSIVFSDVDGDDDQDVLISGVFNNTQASVAKLYINDGTGNFSEMPETPFDGVAYGSIAFADVDGDNDQDVLITGYNGTSRIAKLYTNDGTGNFSEMSGTPFDGVAYSAIAFADVDGDNDQDVLITGGRMNATLISKLYTNDGMGCFSEMPGTPFDDITGSSIAFTDVDGDNDKDVLITGQNGSTRISKLYTNDGTGNFSELAGTPFEGVQMSSIAFADVDGDNDQDILITGRNNSQASISKLYINNGMISSSNDLLVNLSQSLTLFPNPTMSDKLNVSFNSTESNSIIIQFYDVNGRLIIQQREFVGTGEQTIVVDVTSLPTGSYFLQLANGKKIGVATFLVH